MYFEILDRRSPRRAQAEAMIRHVYETRYGAKIDAFPDRIAAAFCADGMPLSAAGLRTADTGFFSEVYLEQPVERAIAGLAREPVDRKTVLEVTTLAAARPGAAFRMIDFIIADGWQAGLRWGLFTATRPLRHGLLRAGAGLIELVRADRNRLSAPATWGRYYETDPFVCAVSGARFLNRSDIPAPIAKQERRIHA